MSDNVISCYYKVHINGAELSNERRECIQSISIEELDNGSNVCTITILDPGLVFIEDDIFIEDVSISAEIGFWEDTHRDTFSGYISAIDIDFPESGSPQLSISCIDNTHLMNREKKTRSWDNVTRADVVEKIAAEYGFMFKAQEGYIYTLEDCISQSGVTDIEFCENLASEERELHKCKLIGDVLCYIKRGLLDSPKATVSYKSGDYDIISFSPRINKETRRESIKKADINTNDKSTDSAIANNESTSRDTQGEPLQTTSEPMQTSGYYYDPSQGVFVEKKPPLRKPGESLFDRYLGIGNNYVP